MLIISECFGYIAYVHVANKKIQKLDPKSESCIFFGYSEQSNTYKLYKPLTNRIVVSRDVIFDEGVYGHQKRYVEMSKSILNGGIIDDNDHKNPTNIPVPSSTNPSNSPSSNSSIPSAIPALSISSTRKVRIIGGIYQRSTHQAHE